MRSLDCRSEVALSAKQEGKTTISCLPSYDPHRPAHRRAHQPLNQRGTPRAGTRPRQQCLPSSQGTEEEDAARGHLPRDEAPRPLRETLREESPREGGSHPPRPQARAQEIAARGPAADEVSGDPRGPGKRRPRARPPLLISEPSSLFAKYLHSRHSACQIKAAIALLHAAALTALVRGSHTCSVSMERKAGPERISVRVHQAERAQLRNAPLL